MLCFIYKWMISRALDTGKGLPAKVNRHMRRCGACRRFARFSGSLAGRLAQDAAGFLAAGNNTLEEKIIAGLDSQPAAPTTGKIRKHRFVPRPAFAMAAAIVILVVSAGIIFKVIPPGAPGTGAAGDRPFHTITGPAFTGKPLTGLAGSLESSVETEMRSLEKSVKSAAGHLYACLDFKIGEKERNN